jgi:DNA-binding response OmpR family regulator
MGHLLDRDLPGIHGDTLCQMITEWDGRVMVLMLTAADSPGDRVSGLTMGADDYLVKPFHFPELVLRIRALPAAAPPPGPASCARRGSNSTRCAAPPAATAANSNPPSRSSRYSKPS